MQSRSSGVRSLLIVGKAGDDCCKQALTRGATVTGRDHALMGWIDATELGGGSVQESCAIPPSMHSPTH